MAFSDQQKAAISELRSLSQELVDASQQVMVLCADAERRIYQDDPVKEFTWAEGLAWLDPRILATKQAVDDATAALVAHYQTLAGIP